MLARNFIPLITVIPPVELEMTILPTDKVIDLRMSPFASDVGRVTQGRTWQQ